MEEQRFWDIIEQASQDKVSIDNNELGDSLYDILKDLEVEDIVGFHLTILQLREQLKTPFMREIAYMMNYGDNDVAFEGFVNWVIVLGKARYLKAQHSPPYLLTLTDSKLFVVGRPYFPDLNYLCASTYFEKTDLDIEDWNNLISKGLKSIFINNYYS